MVQASRANSNIKARAVAKNRVNEVEASNSKAKYWAEVAEEYAGETKNTKDDILGIAENIENTKNQALTQIAETKEAAIREIEEKGQIGDIPTKVSELENDMDYLSGKDTLKVKSISQEEYNELEEKDENTLYVVLTNILVWGTSLWGTGIWGLGDGELSGNQQ